MILLNIFDIKDFMAKLLIEEAFDSFFLEEARVVTCARMNLSGKRSISWYDTEEQEQAIPELLYWKEAKPYIYQYIRGKKTPSSLMVSLKLSDCSAAQLLQEKTLLAMVQSGQLGCILNIRFENGKLSVVTGCSQMTFTIERIGLQEWDEAVKQYLSRLKITYEQL